MTPDSLCECRYSNNRPHRGEVRAVQIDLNAQPSGHGSYTVPVVAQLCEEHAYWFLNGHVNAWVKE